MFSSDDVRTRCRTVYDSQVKRHRDKLNKAAGVQLDIPSNQVLPYEFQEFFDWVWNRYHADVHKCPWCEAPMDFRSMQFDHPIPIDSGGSMGLDNLNGICKGCNELKGSQNPEQFTKLLTFLGTLHPSHRTYLEQRIRAGAVANRMRWFDHKKKEGGKGKTPKPLAIQQRMNLGSDDKRPF
jgi:5-methylcytosine-specific restriction endonuclease McrA